MGYVYSPQQVERGEVATPEGFGIASEILENGLRKLNQQGYVIGARVHGGPYHDNEPIVGSDMDVLSVILYFGVNRLLTDLYREVWRQTYIPLELVSYPRKNAEKGLHYADQFFIDNVRRDNCIIIGDDPLTIIKEDTSVPIEAIIKKRMDREIQSLGKWRSGLEEAYDEDHCKLLDCTIRWPIYVALDMLRLKLGHTPITREGKIIIKSEICELYKEEFPEADTKNLFLILGLRRRYRDMINHQPVNLKDYKDLLAEIDSSLDGAYSFITENDELVSKYIERGALAWKEKD